MARSCWPRLWESDWWLCLKRLIFTFTPQNHFLYLFERPPSSLSQSSSKGTIFSFGTTYLPKNMQQKTCHTILPALVPPKQRKRKTLIKTTKTLPKAWTLPTALHLRSANEGGAAPAAWCDPGPQLAGLGRGRPLVAVGRWVLGGLGESRDG